MSRIVIVANNRAERGPLESVIAALPEAEVVGLPDAQQKGPPELVMARALEWFTGNFRLKDPSVVVVLGDRYETLAAAQVAMFQRRKIVHIHGGETTTGAFDDALRHSISHLTRQSGGHHCVATAEAAERVYDMLGGPGAGVAETITCTGAPGLDGVPGNSARREEKLILVTYHPVTMADDYGIEGCMEMLEALDHSSLSAFRILISKPNNDPGHTEILTEMDHFRLTRMRADFHEASHDEYVDLMQRAAIVIGNSSAGIIEAGWIGVPSVNIGPRQDGRPRAPSVLQAAPVRSEITLAIKQALPWSGPWSPAYTGDGAGLKIAEVARGLL